MSIVTRNPWLNPGQKKSDLGQAVGCPLEKNIKHNMCLYIYVGGTPQAQDAIVVTKMTWHV